jgi:hypothetical protein
MKEENKGGGRLGIRIFLGGIAASQGCFKIQECCGVIKREKCLEIASLQREGKGGEGLGIDLSHRLVLWGDDRFSKAYFKI